MSTSKKILRNGVMAACVLLLSACAGTGERNPADPIEPVNRAVFQFNDTVDRALIKPVAQGYRFVLPQGVRTSVNNFFSNLRDPWTAINQILQGKVEAGATDFMRFVTNTTFGIGGIFDVATEAGMDKHFEDFGQTLGVWGVGTGPYLVLPLAGPSNARDGVGLFVDVQTSLIWKGPEWFGFDHYVAWRNALSVLDLINLRANLLDTTNMLEDAALDRYSFVRDAYLQRRQSQVNDGIRGRRAEAVDAAQMENARIPADVQTLPIIEASASSANDSQTFIASTQLP